jgi:hypothetical protein
MIPAGSGRLLKKSMPAEESIILYRRDSSHLVKVKIGKP